MPVDSQQHPGPFVTLNNNSLRSNGPNPSQPLPSHQVLAVSGNSSKNLKVGWQHGCSLGVVEETHVVPFLNKFLGTLGGGSSWRFSVSVMVSDLGLDGIGMGFIQQYILAGSIFNLPTINKAVFVLPKGGYPQETDLIETD